MSIVEQLRQERPQFYETLMKQAADEIERLRSMRECTEEQCPYEAQRAEIERLRAALRECSDELEAYIKHHYDRTLDYPSRRQKYDGEMQAVTEARKLLGAEQTGTEPDQSHDNQPVNP